MLRRGSSLLQRGALLDASVCRHITRRARRRHATCGDRRELGHVHVRGGGTRSWIRRECGVAKSRTFRLPSFLVVA
jgi:hypothetical protein